ncbi:MAG: J domain-containing protein [Cyanobacteria bacterium REEB459]|nr:J domain-containing protein [Cyanobacteria bacterium REEB459]
MVLAHQYRILGLRTGASFTDIKLAYRQLARLYHPDTNPGNSQAKDKFIQVTQAYRALTQALPPAATRIQQEQSPFRSSPAPGYQAASRPEPGRPQSSGVPPASPAAVPPNRSDQAASRPVLSNQDLKQIGFHQLQGFFRSRRYARAIALVEGLAHRFPQDPEVRQWQAITYYRWGQASISSGEFNKAAACLHKARRVDPKNRSLGQALEREFHRLQQVTSTPEDRKPVGTTG